MQMVDRKKRWYVVSTQSGKEHEVKANIDARIESMNMQNYIFQTLIAEEEITTTKKNGEQVTKMKNLYPRYIYVQMDMTDDAWYVVRNTPGVTGIIGSSGKGTKPSPVSEEDMAKVLQHTGCYDENTASRFAEGTLCKVLRGLYQNNEGHVISVDTISNQVTLEISMLSGSVKAQVTLPFSDVEPVEQR